MTEPVSSSSSSSSLSSSSPTGMTIDIRPMIEDVSQVMTKHITNILTGVIGEYTIYKETHDTIMGLPCVRKLQQRIASLENGGEAYMNASEPTAAANSNSRQDEVAQLQAAIAEMNRYIAALESKVNSNSKAEPITDDEESVKLEIHEDEDAVVCEDKSAGESFTLSSTHKNVIISALADDTAVEAEEAEAEEAEEEEAEEEEAEEEAAAVEADAEEAEAEEAEAEEAAAEVEKEAEVEEEAAEEEEAEDEEEEEAVAEEAEAEEAEAEEAEADEEAEAVAEEAEAEEEEAEEEAEEEEAEEEAEIEVSEVKIKGKTYFTTDPQNGIIYACVDDDVGDEVGVFKNGVAVFNKGKK